MNQVKHINIKIYGQVQGVFFRETAKREAEKLGIVGFVKNEEDGAVYIEAEGIDENLKKLVDWCKEGPERALVEKIEVKNGKVKNFSEFKRDFRDF